MTNIRPLAKSDVSDLSRYINNRKIWDNLRDYIPHPFIEKDGLDFYNRIKDVRPTQVFAIESNGAFCGIISVIVQSDIYRKSGELGYWLAEPYWRQGIMTEAVSLITTYALDTLDLRRIYAGVFEYNIGSMRVLEKNGYRKEGVFEKAIWKNETIFDEHRYSKVQP